MSLASNLLIATLALTLCPAAAFAQTWSPVAVSGLPATAEKGRDLIAAERPSRSKPAPGAPPLHIKPRVADLSRATQGPDYDVRPKPEWSDDQGFRVSPTRVAFKGRF